MVRQVEQSTLFDLSTFSRPEKSQVGDWGWENQSETPEPEIRRFQIGDRIQAKLPNSPEGIIVEIKQGKYPWSDTLLIEWDANVPRKQKGTRSAISSGKATLTESYPTESVIDESKSSGKTDLEERDEAIAKEYAETMITIVKLAQKYNLPAREAVDILSTRLGDQYRELTEFKRQQNQRRYLTKDQIAPDTSGNWPPIPSSYPTESVIEESESSGKTELEERDEAIALEFKDPQTSPLKLAQKYGISPKEVFDILSARLGDQLREVSELKWQEARRQNLPPTQEAEIQEDTKGDRTPSPSLFPMEEKYGPVESWPDSPEEGMFDFLSYPTETGIEDSDLSGKTDDIPAEGDSPSYPTETGDRPEDLTGKTIREQILPLSISEKRSLLIWLQETIKDEEWTPPPVKSGRQVVGEPVKTSKGYRRQELVRCGKATCKSCPHGPYWYEYWSEGGKRRSKYVGKNP